MCRTYRCVRPERDPEVGWLGAQPDRFRLPVVLPAVGGSLRGARKEYGSGGRPTPIPVKLPSSSAQLQEDSVFVPGDDMGRHAFTCCRSPCGPCESFAEATCGAVVFPAPNVGLTLSATVQTWLSGLMDSNYVNGGGMWFAIALINAGLAEQKNRSRLAWFFVSLFIGPFATLLIVVLPRPVVAR